MIGYIDDATDPMAPLVRIRADSTPQATANYVHDYVPTVGDQVIVGLEGGNRIITNARPGSPWRTSPLPSPIFAAGVTIGDGTFAGVQWCLRRDNGRWMIDYQGRFTLGATSAVTASVQLTIPGGFSTPATPVQYANTAYIDGLTTWHGRAAASTSASVVVLQHGTGANFGVLSASDPFVWGSGDAIRWDIRDLEIAV